MPLVLPWQKDEASPMAYTLTLRSSGTMMLVASMLKPVHPPCTSRQRSHPCYRDMACLRHVRRCPTSP